MFKKSLIVIFIGSLIAIGILKAILLRNEDLNNTEVLIGIFFISIFLFSALLSVIAYVYFNLREEEKELKKKTQNTSYGEAIPSKSDRLVASLSYILTWTWFYVIRQKFARHSSFVRFHMVQAAILTDIFWIILGLLFWVIPITNYFFPSVASFYNTYGLGIILGFLILYLGIFMGVLAYETYRRHDFRLPFVSRLAQKFSDRFALLVISEPILIIIVVISLYLAAILNIP